MEFLISLRFNPDLDEETFLLSIPNKPAVFALFAEPASGENPPYLGRTVDLRRRLGRLLGRRAKKSRLLNLREVARRIDYRCVGSDFEALWLLYIFNKHYYPKLYRQRLRLKPPALLKLNLSNRFPRVYPTRRLINDDSLYFGPFPSRLAAEKFAAEFLDFFTIRRCVEDLHPDPSHPGCIYSQMRMCLAPCFGGCTDEQYQGEVERVIAFLDSEGRPLIRALEDERAQAAERLEFEQAAKAHRKIEKVHEVLRLRPDLARNVRDLHAVVVERGAEEKTVIFFRVCAGEIRGPVTLSLDENVSSPEPLDQQIHKLLDPLSIDTPSGPVAETMGCQKTAARHRKQEPPPWEHLSLLARWYYSSFRRGEFLMLPPNQQIPHARVIRACRKVLAE